MKRRTFLKGGIAASAATVAASAGLLAPTAVLAAWPKSAFESKDVKAAMSAIAGGDSPTTDTSIKFSKTPDIAENGAVVPVTVSTGMTGVESISIFAPNNPSPLLASFKLGEGALPYASTRIKLAKTGDVIALVKANGKLLMNKKQVKVTIGGCGG